jgi:nucleotide-binding universal stress UspA family protein
MYKHILLPTDGSELSDKAAKQAVQFAKSIGARLTAMNITSDYPLMVEDRVQIPEAIKKQYYGDSAKGSKKLLAKVEADALAAGVDYRGVSVHANEPYEAIIKQAKQDQCDLIMMASHGRKGLAGVLIGSETIKVLTHSTIPVLVVR